MRLYFLQRFLVLHNDIIISQVIKVSAILSNSKEGIISKRAREHREFILIMLDFPLNCRPISINNLLVFVNK